MPTAIVTGASGALGKAISAALLRASWSVVLVGRRKAALDEAAASLGGGEAIAADVADESSVVALFDEARARVGSCDLLVNCAGVAGGGPTVEMSGASFSHVLAVNVTGTFLCAREAMKQMCAAGGGGRIVNVGSISAQAPRPHAAAYCASKFAVDGLTRSLALDGRPHGISVGVVHPGNVISELLSPQEIERRRAAEGFIEPADVAASVMLMATLPLSANVLELTVMPTTQPLVGRG